MIVKHLKINNLRNIQSVEIDPHPQFNILFGDNGAGKTSVIESMVVLAKGRSFRSGQVAALIGPVTDSFRVVAEIQEGDKAVCRLGLERSADAWKARMNGENVNQISDLAPRLPLVLLEPNSHLLISGAPDGRRKYLDWGVFHVKQGHLEAWRRYSRAVRQRNAALKAGDRRLAASLDPQLVQLGGELEEGRRDFTAKLSGQAEELLGELSPAMKPVSLNYHPGWRGEDLGESLRRNMGRDLERGSTGSGPHRGDLAIRLDGALAKERLSRGEQKVLAAALLLGQASIMKAAGVTPLLLMDDLSSEFDGLHLRNVLVAGAAMNTQSWVTGTSADPYLEAGSAEVGMFHVKQGEVLTHQGA